MAWTEYHIAEPHFDPILMSLQNVTCHASTPLLTKLMSMNGEMEATNPILADHQRSPLTAESTST